VTQAQRFVCSLSKMLKPGDWKHLGDSLQDALSLAAKAPPLGSVTRSDREEALATWLEQQNVSEGWKLAPALVNAGLDPGWFEDFIGKLPAGSAQDAVGWLESNLMLKSLTGELQQSTARISDLVKAVKAYSYMDQPAKQEIDIHEGIENTLTVLGHKLKGITVNRVFDRTLPRIMAHGGELNQVWTNLIDNAIDAVKGAFEAMIAGKLNVRSNAPGSLRNVFIVSPSHAGRPRRASLGRGLPWSPQRARLNQSPLLDASD
jgi:hypothetical protein